jgi:hypothetical protein
MPNMQVTIRFWRKASEHSAIVGVILEVFFNNFFQKIQRFIVDHAKGVKGVKIRRNPH